MVKEPKHFIRAIIHSAMLISIKKLPFTISIVANSLDINLKNLQWCPRLTK
jgi:hypothetical protein